VRIADGEEEEASEGASAKVRDRGAARKASRYTEASFQEPGKREFDRRFGALIFWGSHVQNHGPITDRPSRANYPTKLIGAVARMY
jgi:hypothetical protein